MLSLFEFEQQLAKCITTEQIEDFIRTFDVAAPDTTSSSSSVFYTKSINGDPN